MKTYILFFALLFATLSASAQVWAPAGATWYYDWIEWATDGYAKIHYTTDSVVGGKLCKVLEIENHTYDWTTHTYHDGVLGYEYTYLENNIVYYYRFGHFYTLYDFSSAPGTTWSVAGWEQGFPCDSTGTVVLDSTGVTTINSFPLKYLKVSPGQNSGWEFMDKIIERIGCLGYMFPGPNCVIDIPGPGQLRCYSDNEFGLYQRPVFPPACDYIIGMDDRPRGFNEVNIYPVPASTAITVEVAGQFTGRLGIEISDITGIKIKSLDSEDAKTVIVTEDLPDGIYLLTITSRNGCKWNTKFVKIAAR